MTYQGFTVFRHTTTFEMQIVLTFINYTFLEEKCTSLNHMYSSLSFLGYNI
jgi:hypothetical protein